MAVTKLTILWHSVAPFIESGYGRVTRNVLTRLVKYGYKCICSAYYGVEPGGIINYNGVYIVASKEGPFGIISASKYAKQFRTDINILHTDWWAFSKFPELLPVSVLYSPLDHEHYPEEIVSFTRKYWKRITFCKWAYRIMKEQMKLDSIVIPHGVDVNIYKPMDKVRCKQQFGITKDTFVFGSVCANSDKEMGGGRKSWGVCMKAMRYFLDNNPDVKDIVWLAHTNPADPRGFPLVNMARKYNLENIIKFASPEVQKTGLSEQQMVVLYNAFDVCLNPAKREGFGLPVLEAMSCGIPVIAHDFSSMTELVEGHGWLVKSVCRDLNMELTPLLAETAIPDVYDLADKMKQAYFKDKRREKYGKLSRKFALQYNWDDIIHDKWVKFFEDIEEEARSLPGRAIFGISSRKDELFKTKFEEIMK